MLHILWMLIKIILILLGIILGLAVLCLCLLLFCPVRYKIRALKTQDDPGNTEAQIKINWLFGGVSFSYFISRTQKVPSLRLFGIPVLTLVKKWKTHGKKGKAEKKSTGTVSEKNIPQEKREEQNHVRQKPATVQSQETARRESQKEKTEDTEKRKNKGLLFLEKLKGLRTSFANILHTLKRISLTMENIYDKINYWKQFMENPRVQAGFTLAKQELLRLFRHIFPKKIKGRVSFGSEDPSVTGAVLAVLGITVPLHQNRVAVQPVFENRNLLEGNISLQGRVYGILPLMIFIKLYFDKNIKYIVYRWKNKEV